MAKNAKPEDKKALEDALNKAKQMAKSEPPKMDPNARANELPRIAAQPPDDFDHWFSGLDGLSFGKQLIEYKRLEDTVKNKVIAKKVTIIQGSFELELEALPKDNKLKVFRITKSDLFKEAFTTPYKIVAMFLSGSQTGLGKDGTPTYLPIAGQGVKDLDKPIVVKHIHDPSATDVIKREFYYIEESEYPPEAEKSRMLIFIMQAETKPREGRLMWLKKKTP